VDKELAELEKQLAAIKAKINQTIGQRDSILKRMQSEYGVSTIAEAQAKIAELEAIEAQGKKTWEKLKQEYVALWEAS
jgi:predicted nuclease with TOPRIM domain